MASRDAVTYSARRWAAELEFAREPHSGDLVKLSLVEKSVLRALAELENRHEGCAWPSLKQLMTITGGSRNTVRRGLDRLQELGLIQVFEKPTPTSSTRYVLHVPELYRLADDAWSEANAERARNGRGL